MNTEEMQRLQEEAKNRVYEMSRRSKFAVKQMQSDELNMKPEKNQTIITVPEEPKHIRMPVYEEEKTNEVINKREKEAPPKEHNPTGERITKKIKLTTEEEERLFLLSVCLLLSSEPQNDDLLLALMYVIG